jgi:SAM-dependent methyltransferase
MTTIAALGPNADQIEFWNGLTGDRWVQHQNALDAMISGIGNDALARADVQQGERILDIGCGCGQTTLELARRVGPSGSVTGIDISAPMLEHARSRADGIENVNFENADAETHTFADGGFDLLFSRFGVMFFNDPVAAFRNLGSLLKPGGRLAFACWRQPEDNLWLVLPTKAAGEHVEMPPRPGPEDPSPFAFADEGRLQKILTEAGFSDVTLQRRDGALKLGGPNTLEGAVQFALSVGPATNALQGVDSGTLEKVIDSVREVLEPHFTGSAVEMASSVWIVSASRL